MHHPTDNSPSGTTSETHLTYEGANKIIQKLSPDMVEHIFRFISGEEVMRTADIARILGYLGCKDVMRARVSRKWREAAKMTLVPDCFSVNSVRSYNAMRVMTAALPNMQRLSIRRLDEGHKYSDGEDLDPREDSSELMTEVERKIHAGNYTHDINIISNFRKLRDLSIDFSPLNGRYPALFNFPLLQRLSIFAAGNLRFDLDMLSGLPLLEELMLGSLHCTGNIRSLRAQRDTLKNVDIYKCPNIRGNFMVLADLLHLKYLELKGTFVSGDIRDISRDDFPVLEKLILPKTVHGGLDYKFHSVSDVPSFMQAIHLLCQRTPPLFHQNLLEVALFWELSKDSDEWYDWEHDGLQPPFKLECVQAGSRFGWRWTNYNYFLDEIYSDDEDEEDLYQACEMNWLDAGPNSTSIRQAQIFKGYTQPPTKDEFCQLLKQRE